MENVFKTNRMTVIGTLVETDLDVKTARSGQDYVGGTITVKSVINGSEQLTDIRLFAFRFKKDTTVTNKLFESYNALAEQIGRRIEVSGSIDEGRFYQESGAQVISFNNNSGRFINKAKTAELDCADFEFAGYIVKPLTERLNSADEIVAYEMVIAQANYNATKPIYVKFTVAADETEKAAAVQDLYQVGDTVVIKGEISVKTEEVTKEQPTAFGKPMIKVYTNTYKTYLIASGSEPVTGKGEYSASDIRTLKRVYEDEGFNLEQKAKDNSNTSDSKTGATSGFGSLL